MVPMTILFVIVILAGLRLALKARDDRYDWRSSRTFKGITVAIPILLVLAMWYRIDSHPLWVARADAHTTVDYFVDAKGAPEVVDMTVDHMPTWWWPDRPQPRVTNTFSDCNTTYPASSTAQISVIQQDDWRPLFDQIQRDLEADGWETLVPSSVGEALSDPNWQGTFLHVFRGDRTISIGHSGNQGDITHFRLNANSTCPEKITHGFGEN